MRLRWLGIWAMLVCGQPLAADDAVKKVLLIGIDGCRTDALLAAHAPHLQRLGKTGALSLSNDVLGDRKSGADSVTLPGWASMLTGVWADKHGVRDNGHRKPALFATFFSRARAGNSKATTVAFLSFRSVTDLVFGDGDGARMVLEGSKNGFDKADEAVTTEAIQYLTQKDPTITFVYFGQVDSAGHRHGFHPKIELYTAAIAAVDRHVGKILEALTQRPTYANEDWLIIVGADHGGRGLSHTGAGSYDEVRRTFLIVSGPSSSQAAMPKKTANVDVAATALTHLGIAIRPEWRLDGECVGLKQKELPARNVD